VFPRLIRPYVDPILKVLIPKLRGTDQNPMVVASVLRAIGDLAPVGLIILFINSSFDIFLLQTQFQFFFPIGKFLSRNLIYHSTNKKILTISY